jgi:PAS domain-containing protein
MPLRVDDALAIEIVDAARSLRARRARRRLREAEDIFRDAPDASDFRELFEETPEGVFVSDVDGRWTDVNPAGCRMLGYSREELLGRRIVDFLPPEDAGWFVDDY